MGPVVENKARSRHEKTFVIAFVGCVAGLAVGVQTDLAIFFPKLLSGFWITIEIVVASTLISFVLAVITGLAKMSSWRVIRYLAVIYSEIFRGTSLLVQLFWLFFVLPHFGITLEPMIVGILGISLNYGAYGSEVVRGAINSIPKGQWESAIALNMGYFDTMRRIIMPQALLAMLPPFSNLMIQLLKGTSLVSLITISDLTFEGYQLDQVTGKTVEIFTIIIIAYFCLSMVISIAFRSLEHKLTTGMMVGRRQS
jgi:polar amino acid transport system permease protein